MAGTRFRSLIYITRPRAQSQVSTQKINTLPETQSGGGRKETGHVVFIRFQNGCERECFAGDGRSDKMWRYCQSSAQESTANLPYPDKNPMPETFLMTEHSLTGKSLNSSLAERLEMKTEEPVLNPQKAANWISIGKLSMCNWPRTPVR